MATFWSNLQKPFLALAPMDGVTDFVFREIIADLAKPDVFFTEFTNTEALNSKGYNKVIGNLKYSEKQRPVVAQIWGIKPENFYKSAKIIQGLKFDGIDINMGCPVKDVLKTGAGAGLINNQDLAKEIIQATKEGAGALPISVKTRIGLDKVVTEEWASFLLNQNIDSLTIHARIAKEMSDVPADWNEILKIVKIKNKVSPDTVIIGNGDVKSYKYALEKHSKYKVDGVMIGRGVFSNPWIFKKTVDIEKHTQTEYLNLLIKHTKLYQDTWGDTKNFHNIKKYFSIYVRDFEGAAELRQSLMRCNGYEEVYKVVSQEL